MSEYGDEGLDKEENEGKPNLKQEKEENDDNYLKDDWEPVDDKFEEHTVEDKWEPVDPSMDNMRENNIKSRNDKEIEKIKKIYDPHEYEQLLEQEAEKAMARIANERMNKAIEEYKKEKVKIGELIDQPIIGKSNEGHNREALKNYIVWFLKNERNAFIDPPPDVYKIIKHVKAQIKQQHSDQKGKKGKKGASGAKKNSGFEFKIPKINEKPKKKNGFFKKTEEEIEEEFTKERYKNLKIKNKK